MVENNGYSMGTAISRGTTMGHDISVKAAAYGIEAIAAPDPAFDGIPGRRRSGPLADA